MTVLDLVDHVKNQIAIAERNKAYFNDLLVRFPDLSSLDIKFPIVINVLEEFKVKNDEFNNTPLIFSIDKKNNMCVIEVEESILEFDLNDSASNIINCLSQQQK